MPTNIEKFDQLTGRIFADLYASFPIPHLMEMTDYLCVATGREDEIMDDESEIPPEGYGPDLLDAADFYDATCKWLEKAGFIEVTAAYLEGSMQVVLTLKGLEALKLPSSLGGKSLGDQLAEATKEGAISQVGALTGQVLTHGLSLGLGAIKGLMS